MGVTLRPFDPADAATGLALTIAFGWPHRIEDWVLMARLGVGVVAEEDGTVLGTALRWPFGPSHAAVGMIGVRPDAQGRGLGRLMTAAVLDAMPTGATALLTATEAGLPLYEKLGFVRGGTVVQMQGIVAEAAVEDGPTLRPLVQADAQAVRALDRDATGVDRTDLLDAVLPGAMSGADGVMAGDVTAGDGGFALVRPFGRGEVIGPVVARTREAAAAMLGHLLNRRASRFVRVDVPEESGLIPLLQAHGLGGGWPGVRMARGTPPQPGRGRVFALASQAWG